MQFVHAGDPMEEVAPSAADKSPGQSDSALGLPGTAPILTKTILSTITITHAGAGNLHHHYG
jgi:hypothetical protein